MIKSLKICSFSKIVVLSFFVLNVIISTAFSITLQSPIEPWTLISYLYEPSSLSISSYVYPVESNGLVIYNGNSLKRFYKIIPPESGTVYFYIKDKNGRDIIPRLSYSASEANKFFINFSQILSFSVVDLPKKLYLIITIEYKYRKLITKEKIIYWEVFYVIKNEKSPQNRIIYALLYIHHDIGSQIAAIKTIIDRKLTNLSKNVAAVAGEIIWKQYLNILPDSIAVFSPVLATAWDVVDALNSATAIMNQNMPILMKFAISYAQAFMCQTDAAFYLAKLVHLYNSLWELVNQLHNTSYRLWRKSLSSLFDNVGKNMHEYLVLLDRYDCNLAYNSYCDWSGVKDIIYGNGSYIGGIFFWDREKLFPEYIYITSKILKRNPSVLAQIYWESSKVLCNEDLHLSDAEVVQFLNEYKFENLIFGNPPRPIITNITYPTSVIKGNLVKININANNKGSDAIYGSITISFPYLKDLSAISIQNSGGLNVYKKLPGDTIYNSSCNSMTARYPMIEFGGQWKSGTTKTVTLLVDTSKLSPGNFKFYVRSTMTSVDDFWCHYKNYPQNSTTIDQQGWEVNSYSFKIVTKPPTGSILIENGALYTKSTSVVLNLNVYDDYTPIDQIQVCIKNSQTTCYPYDWKNFSNTKMWSLPSGDGNKCVYVKFRDSEGNISSWYHDCIILDTTPPSNPSLTATGGDARVTLSWSSVSDSRSGLKEFKLVYSTSGYPSSGCTSGTRLTLSSPIATSYTHTGLTNGRTYYYRLCAIDNAGNVSGGSTALAIPQVTRYTLSVSRTGSGTITSSPSGINCGSTCSASFDRGITVRLTAFPNIDSIFTGWGGDCAGCGSNATCSVVMDGAKSCSAQFELKKYMVTARVGNGKGTVEPLSQKVTHGGVARFTVTPDACYHVEGVDSTCGGTLSGNIFTTGQVTGNCSVVVNFGLNEYTIEAKAGVGGSISPSGNVTVECGGSQIFTIEPDKGYHVKDVVVDGVSKGAMTSYPFRDVKDNHIIEVIFERDRYRLSVSVEGGGGKIDCGGECYTDYDSGTKVTLKAIPDEGYSFAGWEGDCAECGNDRICPLVMDDSKSCTARFEPIQTQNQPPVIDLFSANPTSVEAPLSVEFVCTAHDPDGRIVEYTFQFGDGNNVTDYDGRVTHIYDKAGTYKARCVAKDDKGATAISNPLVIEVATTNQEPSCDAQHLNLCTTEADCVRAGGYWYNGSCHASPQSPSCENGVDTLILQNVYGHPGSEVVVPVILNGTSTTIGGISFTVTYNPAVLSFDRVEGARILQGGLITPYDNGSVVRIGIISATGISGSGEILRLIFRVNPISVAQTVVDLEIPQVEFANLEGNTFSGCGLGAKVYVDTNPIEVTMICSKEVNARKMFDIVFEIDTKNLTLGGLDLSLGFDAGLSAKGVTAVGLAQGATVQTNNSNLGSYRVGLIKASGFSGKGEVLKVTLEPGLDVTGEVTINISSIQGYDLTGTAVPIKVENGTCRVNVISCTPDGDVAPLGNRDGWVNIGDALVTLRFALGLETPTEEDRCHADVAPLGADGRPNPDGKITIGDALVILRKALGLVSWGYQ
ncbi:InlB B-repeat-containing protein [Thermosulfurimonas dismutans]|uniref:PKD domain-containing protein n=1 Tax=Thermosulfurimonas dismutans TaxID=999894 RepID=A0A179D4D3_9BACT|nr:PKD domain-containing protein [Thermosulfurimonas dismutans]OAQ20917.1 hypothetical protein TDIS_1044 [Thermosulfurimonas dismutans]